MYEIIIINLTLHQLFAFSPLKCTQFNIPLVSIEDHGGFLFCGDAIYPRSG